MDDRVTLQMSGRDAIIAMSEGNPGALSVCMQFIDREAGLLDLLRLDTERVYGPSLWIAYKDICGEDIEALHDQITSGELFEKLATNNEYLYYRAQQE